MTAENPDATAPHPTAPASLTTPAIRRATPADADAIARIHLASRVGTMPYLPPQRRGHEAVSRWIRDIVLRDCRVWVALHSAEHGPGQGTEHSAEHDAEPVGYAALEGDVLEHLYLNPDVRRLGIGTLLLDEVRRHSPAGLSLHVFQQNTDARAFYARHGFTVLDTSDGSGNMENLPDMTLRWVPEAGDLLEELLQAKESEIGPPLPEVQNRA